MIARLSGAGYQRDWSLKVLDVFVPQVSVGKGTGPLAGRRVVAHIIFLERRVPTSPSPLCAYLF